MKEHITVKATLAAWVYQSEYSGLDSLLRSIEGGHKVNAVQMLSFYGSPDAKKFCDYIRVGEADITVRLLPKDEQTRMAVAALKGKLDELRAAYLQKQQDILAEISKFESLTNEVEA